MTSFMFTVVITFITSLVLHEFGHFVAARLCGICVNGIGFGWGPRLFTLHFRKIELDLRLLPIGAYVRMDMKELAQTSLLEQLSVLGAGIVVNLFLAIATWGTVFSAINLAFAIGNFLPIYQQDGWKIGIVLARYILGRRSAVVEWTLTFSGALIGLLVIAKAIVN
jgi:membrane-associated protease RseP (regulator of RpoE activity)